MLVCLAAICALNLLSGCASKGIWTIGDFDRYWSDETEGMQDGYTVAYWAEASHENRTMKEARRTLSVSNAEARFSERAQPVADKVSVSAANDAINHDEDYQDLLRESSIATQERDWSIWVDEQKSHRPRDDD